jgi:hypothetical protein
MGQPLEECLDVNLDPVTPAQVRGLSLEEVTAEHETMGLYTRTLDTLEQIGFDEEANNLIHRSLELGILMHSRQKRTNGHYADHLMRVTLHLLEDLDIRDPNLIAAAPLHDTFEDHPRDLANKLTGIKPDSVRLAMPIARKALAAYTNAEVVSIVEAVTNPPVPKGKTKLEVYTQHTQHLVQTSQKGRVLKLADFIDNAVGNHTTVGEKRLKLDLKYIGQYAIHRAGLFLPDSLIVGEARERACSLLDQGYDRALERLTADAA